MVLGVSYELLKCTAEKGRLPVVNFAAGGLGKRNIRNIEFFDHWNVECIYVIEISKYNIYTANIL